VLYFWMVPHAKDHCFVADVAHRCHVYQDTRAIRVLGYYEIAMRDIETRFLELDTVAEFHQSGKTKSSCTLARLFNSSSMRAWSSGEMFPAFRMSR
jgi:hypothetical protein